MKLQSKYNIILASESPRRKELFNTLGIPYTVRPSGVDEELEGVYTPAETAIAIADLKATAISAQHPEAIIIAADTTVWVNNENLAKPVDVEEAKEFMRKLSGNVHEVITGVTILGPNVSIAFAESTLVKFYELSEEEINAYVASGDPMDKAGGYGIQTMGGLFVEKIEGDYQNVVGLPISRLYQTLRQLGIIEIVGDSTQ